MADGLPNFVLVGLADTGAKGERERAALLKCGFGFLLAVNLLFLVLGCFLDMSIMLLVLVPILLPTAQQLGVDLVHFGVMVVVNMMIGMVTPPFGMLLFVINALAGVSLKEMIRESWVFISVLIVALAVITFVPQTVLWLPQVLGYVGK